MPKTTPLLKEQHDAAVGRSGIKLNPIKLILSFFGITLPEGTESVGEAAQSAAIKGISEIPVLGDFVSGVLNAKQVITGAADDLLASGEKATAPQKPSSKLDELFSDIKIDNTAAMSAIAPTQLSEDIGKPVGGNETLNDFFSFLRSVVPNGRSRAQ